MRNLIEGQKDFWTAPYRVHTRDLDYLVPFIGISAGLMGADQDIEKRLPTSTSFIKQSNNFANYGAAAMAGTVGAAWAWGHFTGNDHLRDTGMMAGEAAVNSFLITYAIKSIAGRQRPYEGDHTGTFRAGGSSFPSEHAAAAWSIATVFAQQYPSPFVKLLAYGAATGMTAARVTSGKHFASDAFVGMGLGYFLGRQAYSRHRDSEYDRARYGTFVRTREGSPPDPGEIGSSFVPVDSWVYPAFSRLAAMGYMPTAFANLRPWTRMECERLLQEAGDRILADDRGAGEARRLYDQLRAEFVPEARVYAGERNRSATLESVYTRITGISGPVIRDSYHLGQSMVNDYGRPFAEGANLISGVTSHAEAGPLTFYVRAEYEHSPSSPALPLAVRQNIASVDVTPLQPAVPFAAVDRLRMIEGYATLNWHNNQISFGKQDMVWGPGEMGPMLFSNNAEPLYMLRWTQGNPFKLPWLFSYLGPVRTEFFIGRLAGHHFPPNPYIDGQKISFKPTENLELGFSKVTVFGGGGLPISWHRFWKSIASAGDHPGLTQDPGDRRGSFDFSYRVPKLRNWLVLYTDSLVDDDPSPLAAPNRAAWNPGIYMPRIPGLKNMDFRAEYTYTDVPVPDSVRGTFFYANTNFRDSHINDGNLMGSWVGREGRGLQLWSTYWFTAHNKIQLGYRHGQVAGDFITGAGTMNDVSARTDWLVRGNFAVSGLLQVQRWNYPILSNQLQSNVAASIQITYWPKLTIR